MLNQALVVMILYPFYLMPRRCQIGLSYLLAYFWYYILRLRVSLAKKQIRLVYPQKTAREVNRICFKSLQSLCLVMFEYSYMRFKTDKLKKYTKISGLENLQQAVDSGRPVFLMTGHFAGFELILFRICLEGFKLNLIGKRVKNSFLDEALFSLRERSGLKHIAPKNGAVGVLRAIKKGEAVVFVMDQYMHPTQGVETKFLGHETYTNSALAFFAKRFDALVVPAAMTRQGLDSHVEFFKPISYEDLSEDKDESLRLMTQKYNDFLAEVIHKNPDEWMWVHRRWKNLKEKGF